MSDEITIDRAYVAAIHAEIAAADEAFQAKRRQYNALTALLRSHGRADWIVELGSPVAPPKGVRPDSWVAKIHSALSYADEGWLSVSQLMDALPGINPHYLYNALSKETKRGRLQRSNGRYALTQA